MSQQVNVRVADDGQAELIRRIARALRDNPDKARQLQAVLDDSTHGNRLDDIERRLAQLERALPAGGEAHQAAQAVDTHRQDTPPSEGQAKRELKRAEDGLVAEARKAIGMPPEPGSENAPQQLGAGRGKPLSQSQVDWIHQRYQQAVDAGDTRGVKVEISRTLGISQSAVTRRLKIAGFS